MSLSVQGLTLRREGVAHLDDVELEFPRGRLTTVIGRTLAGKTTLLRTLAGLLTPDAGSIALDGRPIDDVPAWKRDVAMVYQQFINYPNLDVFENVAFPLRRRGVAEPELGNRVRATLAKVGLAEFQQRRPSQLSGGQQQRVALARALVRGAPILLLDEPVVNLDYKLREQIRSEFRGLLTSASGAIVVYTTTEPAEAMMLGDTVVVMHEGKVLQRGSPAEVFERPASATVAEVFSDPPMNFVDGRFDGGCITVAGAAPLAAAGGVSSLRPGDYRFGIRAKDVRIDAASPLSGRITFVEVSGSETFVQVDTPFGALTLQLEGIHDFSLGEPVPIALDPRRLFAFDRAGALVGAPSR
ncbi:MAG: ABC transporter ATP-binding protein [Lautropia sp.]|nr:MAG: ABC transporter ATP-binding protein [Pseudomonadota bacterium]MBC6958788.1 ABC transporter ATP-binding protein [Lautropia sp.]MDL1907802.1 ABC transporter ATP-binding protein [Betaproteobacteria bacterium PRO1]RIK89383.1 MAG: ABC transporter ATP-binding protein [Burkholderiales bacterium]